MFSHSESIHVQNCMKPDRTISLERYRLLRQAPQHLLITAYLLTDHQLRILIFSQLFGEKVKKLLLK